MNPFDIMKNAQAMQKQLAQIKAEIEQLTATGSAGGNMVKITVDGTFAIRDIVLDPICVDNRDIPMLQDLIKAAHHAAIQNLQQLMKDKYGPMLGALNLGA